MNSNEKNPGLVGRGKAKVHDNTSDIVGVRWDNRRLQWQALIAIEGRHYVGFFDSKLDAAAARDLFILENDLPNKTSHPSIREYLRK